MLPTLHHQYLTSFVPLTLQSSRELLWQDHPSHVVWMYYQPKTLPVHLPVLCKIIKMSLNKGMFPGKLKAADVTPIIKKASLDQNVFMYLRTIDLCPTLYTGKLIEKVVLKRLSEHMSQYGLNEPLQSAYRPPETALMKVQHDIAKELDENRGVALVLLDLSAAFDTINTKGVVTTLQQHIGVEGTALAWFEDYLTKRTQRIRIG